MLLRDLEYLAALDHERHFGRAAAACHVTQPALSAGIRRLELDLGVPLVRRGRRFEDFTVEGQHVLVWARRMLTDAQGLRQDVASLRGGLDGTLRLGVIPTGLTASALVTSRFRERHPRMHVELRSMTSREIAAGLHDGTLDAGLTYLDNEPLADVRTRALWHERYLLIRPAAAAAPSPTVAWVQAAALPLCLLTDDMQHRRIVSAAFEAAGARPQPVVETDSVSALIAHARGGLPGIVAHTWLVAHALPDDLRAVPLVEPVVEHVVGLVTSATVAHTPVVEQLAGLFGAFELDAELALD